MAAIPVSVSPHALAADSRSLAALRNTADTDPQAAIKEASKQFEGLFMQELMKSMRQSTMSSGMLDNEGTKMGTDLLDTQMTTQLSGMPGGLADVIARQLQHQMGVPAGSAGQTTAAAATQLRTTGTVDVQSQKVAGSAASFVQQHQQAAHAAEAETGIPAGFLIAQAAHETGWGKRDIRNADGTSSHNLFGIKAGGSWTGPTAEVTTTEYIHGRPQKVTARFRSYASDSDAFADYAKMMKSSPRYQGVVAHASDAKSFAYGLQKAGYATDPAYADKLSKVINTTLRLQRSLA